MALKTNNHESLLSSTAERLRASGDFARKTGHATLEKLRWGPEVTDEMLYPTSAEKENRETVEPPVPDDHLFTHDILHSPSAFVAHSDTETGTKKHSNN